MKSGDIFWLGLKGLGDKKVRSGLTILMVIIGVASIISLVSQTTGISASINSSLLSLGPTTIVVTPTGTRLTDADVARISSLPKVQAVIPMITARVSMTLAGTPTILNVIGVNHQGLLTLLGSINLYQGAVYPDEPSPLSLVGYNLAFPTANGGKQSISVGQPIVLREQVGTFIRTIHVSAAGLLRSYGSSPFIPIDGSIFISLDAAANLFQRSAYSELLVKAADPTSVNSIVQVLSIIYGNSAQVITIQQVTQIVSQITGQIGILLAAIAGISLTVAAIGIMNIMFVSVLERTHEIGILKALGFKDRQVLLEFLAQAAIMGLIGGILGILVGSGVSYILPTLFTGFQAGGTSTAGGRTATSSVNAFGPASQFTSLAYTPIITVDIVGVSLVIAVAVSILAGLYPAWRASKMEPIKALRYE